jgi:hypothetical protein
MLKFGGFMKGGNAGRDRRTKDSAPFPGLMERRKSYYHGKYNRRMLSVFIVLACVIVFMMGHGI